MFYHHGRTSVLFSSYRYIPIPIFSNTCSNVSFDKNYLRLYHWIILIQWEVGMTPKEYAQAAAHHDLEIDLLRDAWLRGFTLEQRIRLGLQEEWLQRTWLKYRKGQEDGR